MKWTTAGIVSALLLLGGCGGGGDKAGDGADPRMPDCAQVWVADQTLPADYEGCVNDAGDIEAAVTQECTDGSQFAGYQDRYWATLGGQIKDSGATNGTASSTDYAADYATCFAD